MAKINILPKHISDLIAAGEVVERPASIVKETVENSIDSGATFITVEIKNGGISYIRITDNGSGIEREYIRNAFISHATSKVFDAQDLDSIMTLGFRGEALASIAAVSKVEVMTKTKEDDVGVRYCIEGGEEIVNDDAGCPNGTTIIIRDLFFNTPARMKFLKKDVTEANAVSAIMDRMALSHPEISFRFIRDGKETLLTHGDTKQISAIHSIFGNDFANGLIELDYELDNIKITGYISKPLNSRPNRSMQYFFINKRYVKSKTAFVALEEAYKNQIMVGKFPACILNIEMPF
ncbi:MAG: DNA mismatch repair endonuclease MutL, partial [Clostridia bacterium]|nr:DNA mismatch repair endonuclease MutL [Clostridia bacterium]